jgi:hypothetical protein
MHAAGKQVSIIANLSSITHVMLYFMQPFVCVLRLYLSWCVWELDVRVNDRSLPCWYSRRATAFSGNVPKSVRLR